MKPARAARIRRCRQALLWTFGTFLVCQLAAGLLLDFVWPGVRFRGLDYALEQCRTAAASPERPLVLALGSSRFGCGLLTHVVEAELGPDPAAPRVINFSMPGGDFITAEHLYQRARAVGCRPSLVLLEVSPETLARRNLWLDMHSLRQLTWLDGPQFASDLVRSGHALRYLASRFVPLYVHRDHLRHLALQQLGLENPEEVKHRHQLEAFFNAAVVQSEQTFTPEQMVQKSQAGAAYIQRWLRNYQVGGNAKRSFDRLLERCATDGVLVVLVAVPVSTPHRRLYTPEIECAFQSAIRAALVRYPTMRYLDLRGAIPDADFYDNHHTTTAGAQAFSRRLAQELRQAPIVTVSYWR
jgi:hypothetical protein